MRPPSELTTQDLLAKAGEGSADAWNELYVRYREFLLASVRSRVDQAQTGSFEEEDVVQSAFLSAFEHLDGFQYRGEGSLQRWLARIVSNNALSKLRKQTSERRGMPGKKARGVSEVLDESALAPSELVSSAEHEARLMECLEEMPSALREVIVLRDFEQLPWTTIGERTSSANSTVRARYRDAWTRLSRRMNAQGDPGEASP